MTLLEVKFSSEYGKALIASQLCKDLELFHGDIVQITNDITKNSIFAPLSTFDDIDENSIAIGENLADKLGVLESDLVEVILYDGPVSIIKKIEIEYDSHDYDINEIQNNADFKDNLLNFIRSYYLSPYNKFFWPEENAELTITTSEEIPPGNAARLTEFDDEFEITIRPAIESIPFNAFIVIDCSGSMGKIDMKFAKMEGIIQNLITIYSGSSPAHRSLQKYLQHLLPKFSLDESNIRMKRLDATFLSMLLFFNQKISRGKGEKCAIILYSGHQKLFEYNGEFFFSPADLTNIQIIEKIRNEMFHPIDLNINHTIFSNAFLCIEETIDQIVNLSKNPIMILFLTDGKPEPKKLDPPEKIIQNIDSLKKRIPEWGLNFIIYTLGIGKKSMLDGTLLTEIAKKGNGQYNFVEDFRSLSTWFEKLANEFSIVLHNI